MNETKSTERTIRGTLFPAKWDERGEVKGLVIDTDDQDEYFIAQNGKGKELIKFIHENVSLTGVVSEGERGFYNFHVKSYKIQDKIKRLEDEDQEA